MKKFISPSIICGNHLNIESDIIELSKSDYVGMLHIDVMDGNFVPRYGMYPEQVNMIKMLCKNLNFNIPLNIHMMVNNCDTYINNFSSADYITIHVENNDHLNKSIQLIKNVGCKVGLAFNIHSNENILDYIINDVDLIMLMAINPGILGQSTWNGIYDKIKKFKYYTKLSNIQLEIDGGVNISTAYKMLKAGADYLVCGTSSIYKPQEGSLLKNIKTFNDLTEKYYNEL